MIFEFCDCATATGNISRLHFEIRIGSDEKSSIASKVELRVISAVYNEQGLQVLRIINFTVLNKFMSIVHRESYPYVNKSTATYTPLVEFGLIKHHSLDEKVFDIACLKMDTEDYDVAPNDESAITVSHHRSYLSLQRSSQL